MSAKRRTYTATEKDRAITLASQIGVANTARQLGIPESTLRNWGARSPKTFHTSNTATTKRVTHAPKTDLAEQEFVQPPLTSEAPLLTSAQKPPIYLRWYIIVLLALLGGWLSKIPLLSFVFCLAFDVLLIMRIYWQVRRRKQKKLRPDDAFQQPVNWDDELPPRPENTQHIQTTLELLDDLENELASTQEHEQSLAPEESLSQVVKESSSDDSSKEISELNQSQQTELPVTDHCEPKPANQQTGRIKKYASDYHFDHVALCVIKGEEPDFDQMPIGTCLFFEYEPDNQFDHKAVKVSMEGGKKVGYLYRGKLRDMTLDFLCRDEAVLGQVTDNDGHNIKFCMDFFRNNEEDTFLDDLEDDE